MRVTFSVSEMKTNSSALSIINEQIYLHIENIYMKHLYEGISLQIYKFRDSRVLIALNNLYIKYNCLIYLVFRNLYVNR